LIRLRSSSDARTRSIRRCGPISTFSGIDGAGFSPAQATSPIASAASSTERTVRLGDWAAWIARCAAPNGALTTPFTPSAISSASDGSGCGVHGSGSTWRGTGSTSNSTLARSTPAMPSIIE
jgi:hypothetical protein